MCRCNWDKGESGAAPVHLLVDPKMIMGHRENGRGSLYYNCLSGSAIGFCSSLADLACFAYRSGGKTYKNMKTYENISWSKFLSVTSARCVSISALDVPEAGSHYSFGCPWKVWFLARRPRAAKNYLSVSVSTDLLVTRSYVLTYP